MAKAPVEAADAPVQQTATIRDRLATPSEICDWLRMSLKTFNMLAGLGVMERMEPGKYLLKRSIGNAYQRAVTAASGREGNAGKARADQLAASTRIMMLKEEKLRGELINREDVGAQWTTVFRQYRARILALPSRVSARLPHLSRSDIAEIASEINQLLAELADGDSYDYRTDDAGRPSSEPASEEDEAEQVD